MKRGNSDTSNSEANKKSKTILDYFAKPPTGTKEREEKHINIEYDKEKPLQSVQNVLKWKNQTGKAPAHWQEVWDGIVSMREAKVAPVDEYGAGVGNEPELTPEVARFHTLISIMISAQTKDVTTGETMTALRKWGLTIQKVREADQAVIDKLIRKVTWHEKKAWYIKQTADILADKYNNDIPKTYNELLKLPGVGPKMATLCMQEAWKNNVGICVDVHVHRISNRLKWSTAKTPEGTRKQLESWLPRDKWSTINRLLVGFGQTVCTFSHPKCASCAVNKWCPSAFSIDD